MKKFMRILLPALLISVLGSCNGNPFMTNLFSSVDKYKLPSSFSSADDVLSESGDDSFLDSISQDPALANQAITLLHDSLPADPADADSTDQDAAILEANIELAVSGADETINNVNNLLVDVASGSSSIDFSDPSSVISDLFPSGLTADEVSNQISSLLQAAIALDYYGQTLNAGLDPSVNADSGTTAGTALIAGMMTYLVDHVDNGTSTNTPMSKTDAITAIANAIVDPNATMPALVSNSSVDTAATASDAINAMLGSDLTSVVDAGFDLSAFN